MRRCLVFAAAMFMSVPVWGHDFWLQPLRFVFPKPDKVTLLLYVGHAAARERWALRIDRVALFSSVGPDGLVDHKKRLTLQKGKFDAVVPLAKLGTYVFAFRSRASTSDLPFLRFNDYVEQEGLTTIATNRARTGRQRSNGRELYSRRAKAIVQVGPVDTAGVQRVTQPVGLELELVPELHPNTLKVGDALPVRVLYNNRPLVGALVKLNNLDADAKPVAISRTDSRGRATFKLPARGSWQLNVVWSKAITNNPAADYQTVFSSLTFGI